MGSRWVSAAYFDSTADFAKWLVTLVADPAMNVIGNNG